MVVVDCLVESWFVSGSSLSRLNQPDVNDGRRAKASPLSDKILSVLAPLSKDAKISPIFHKVESVY